MPLHPLTKRRLPLPIWQIFLMLIMFVILLNLGFWQLERAKEKRALMASFINQTAPLHLETVKEQPRRYNFATVQLHGQWQMPQSFLLDNQFHDHQLGYHVITPVAIPGEKTWLLVDRGFINKQAVKDARISKPINASSQLISGRVYAPTKQVLLLGSIDNNPGQSQKILERVDFDVVSKLLGHPVYPFILWLDPLDENGFVREWTPVIMPPERHQAYAVQWFSLALVLLCVFVALCRKSVTTIGAS